MDVYLLPLVSTNMRAPYKKMLKDYNKGRGKAKREHCRKFCDDIDSTKDTAKMRKILSKSPWYISSFPMGMFSFITGLFGAERIRESFDQFKAPGPDEIIPKMLLVMVDRLTPFDQFKAPGPDEIIPTMLQVMPYGRFRVLAKLKKLKKDSKDNSIPNTEF
uniref:Uncharacterized protein n=1 Tax=Megaselia scalaris TaxID=36166 RepID=T1GIX9_MEGSC